MKWGEKSLWRKRRNILFKTISPPEQGNVLDLSCGDGQFLELLHSHKPSLKLWGIDMSQEVIKSASAEYPWASFSVSQANTLNFPDGTFDVIFCNMAFHHYQQPRTILENLKRILKKGGIIYIMDLFPKNKASQVIYNWRGCNEDYHFEKYYTFKEARELAEVTNFSIRSLSLTFIPRLQVLELQHI